MKKKPLSQKEAIKKVLDEWTKMPPAKFKKMIEKHKGGFWARSLYYAWTGKKSDK